MSEPLHRGLIACTCGCRTLVHRNRITTIRPLVMRNGRQVPLIEASRVVRKDHAKELAIEITRRAELSDWITEHARPGVMGWLHRLRFILIYRAFVREANYRQSPRARARIVREATLLFLSPGDIANSLARIFEQADQRRAATARERKDTSNE